MAHRLRPFRWKMGIIGWLILCLGAFGAVCGSKCVPATAICSRYWVKIEPHRNLMESEEELKSWCRKQSLFFKCLEDVLLGIYGNYSKLPTDLLVSKMFTEDLCLEGSTSRQRYLDNAACINRLNMDYCTLPEYLEIVTPGDSIPSKCSSAEKTFYCIANSIVDRCGFDAGRLYRYLLTVNNHGEEVCGMGSSGATCEEAAHSELSGIYYGLVNRIGKITEQSTDGLPNEQDSTFLPEETFITEAIKNALDDINSLEDISSVRSTSDYKVTRSTDEFRKRPIISEPFKGLLFYNYSNEEFDFYWRQPGSFPISRVTCEHVFPSHLKVVMFGCYIFHDYEESECNPATEEEEITPELIRDIDSTIPEDSTLDIGEGPDWTRYLRDYRRHRMSWEFFFNAKVITEDRNIIRTNEELVVENPISQVCVKELRFYDILNDKYIDWWQCPGLFSDELRNAILTFLFPTRTRHMDFFFLSATNENGTDGQYTTYIHFYEPVFHSFEKIVCERVNKCHPRGRGVFKCSLERRGIEGCDTCCVQFPYPDVLCPPRHRAVREVKAELEEAFDSSQEGSGALEEESPSEVPTFMVDDEATESSDDSTNITGVLDESEEFIDVDLSELPDNSDIDSSDANFMLLKANSDESTEDLFVVHPDDFSTSEEETLNSHLKSELRIFNNNLVVLKAVPLTADVESTYEIIESNE